MLGIAALIAIVVSGCTGDEQTASPERAQTQRSGLSSPPAELVAQLPRHMRFSLGDDLVLLFRRGGHYHSYHEGLLPHSCPISIDEPDTQREWLKRHRSCVATAAHRIVPLHKAAPSTEKGSHHMRLPQLQDSDEVLWRGVPRSGYIGIDSADVCDRISRFSPDYACEQGNVVLIADPP